MAPGPVFTSYHNFGQNSSEPSPSWVLEFLLLLRLFSAQFLSSLLTLRLFWMRLPLPQFWLSTQFWLLPLFLLSMFASRVNVVFCAGNIISVFKIIIQQFGKHLLHLIRSVLLVNGYCGFFESINAFNFVSESIDRLQCGTRGQLVQIGDGVVLDIQLHKVLKRRERGYVG